jgi:hypothetical protein
MFYWLLIYNDTLQNGTLHNGTFPNGTLYRGTLKNGTLQNSTALLNGTVTKLYIVKKRHMLQSGTL